MDTVRRLGVLSKSGEKKEQNTQIMNKKKERDTSKMARQTWPPGKHLSRNVASWEKDSKASEWRKAEERDPSIDGSMTWQENERKSFGYI